MKKLLFSFVLTAGIVLSAYGIAMADSQNYFEADGDYYQWSFNSATGMLTVDAVYDQDGFWDYTPSLYDIAADVTDITINSIHYSYEKNAAYQFSGFDTRFENLKTVTVNCTCTGLDLSNSTKSLQKITFKNNKAKQTHIYLPTCYNVINISYDKNNTSDYYLEYTSYSGGKATIPANYGNDSHISYSFYYCTIDSLSFANGTKTIPAYAFESCHSFRSLTIPSGVTTIEEGAFSGCQYLSSVSIPASVKTIRYNAFYGCPIETVDYAGTGEQWLGIVKKVNTEEFGTVGGKVLYLNNATVNCSDSVIVIKKKAASDHYTYSQNPVGWFPKSGQWYYYYENGKYARGGVAEIGNCSFYFDSEGVMTTGWVSIDGKWCFFDKSTGAMLKKCWHKDNGNWYYLGSDGAILTGWQEINNTWYYFQGSGAMVTGWKQIGGSWYLFNENGTMVTGWKNMGGTWYYFLDTGVMVTGWQQISGSWYLFNEKGAMLTEWQKSGAHWYYLGTNGAMVTGWKNIGGTWYYFYDNGTMASGGKVKINGTDYTFADNGAWISN